MKALQSSIVRSILAIVLTFAVLVGSVGAASASNGAVTWKDITDTIEVFGTCSDPDGLYLLTIVSSGAVHYVENDNGYQFSWIENATYYMEPIDADSPVTYAGHYNIQLQDEVNKGNSIFRHTHTNVGVGSDGTREVFHFTTLLVFTSSGIERQVDNFQWICN